MATYPLGVKAYRRTDGFVPEVRCLNMYLEKDESGLSPDGLLRIQRPGLFPLYNLNAPIRGMEYRVATSEALAVAGGALFSGQASKGAIAGTDLTEIVSTTFATAIVGGGALHLYDGSSVMVVVVPDINDAPQTPVSVDQLNQYILVLCSSGSFFWIVPGETTIDPLNFATAESSPDQGVAIRRIGDEFWIFGAETTEVWQTTGDLDAPFQRVSGRYYERGCLSRDTVKRFDNSVMWVSNDLQVCRGGAVPQIVSDAGLSQRLRQRSSTPSAWTFQLDGHDFYVLTIPGQGTFPYDALTQEWCEFGTLGAVGWRVGTGYDESGQTFAGDAATGAIWRLDPETSNDGGTAIERVITGTVGIMGRAGRNDSLSIGVGSSADCTIRIRWKDGQEQFPDYYDEIVVREGLEVASIRRMGIPLQPYRTVEISCIDAARIRIAGCTANESWGR